MLKKEISHKKLAPGAYEWWYFDAVSDDGATEFVVIFYEGNPFSRRYINSQKKGNEARAEDFPAVSISVYRYHKAVYYSFTEFAKGDASFRKDAQLIRIGNHSMEAQKHGNQWLYHLTLNELLPSAYSIRADLTFRSNSIPDEFKERFETKNNKHSWKVEQSCAEVSGKIACTSAKKKGNLVVDFSGKGYHDHNVGSEPLNRQFDEWYWGRFHFNELTFIYYVAEREKPDFKAWLVDEKVGKIKQVFDAPEMKDHGRTWWGLRTARKLLFSKNETQLLIQQRHLLDNGPFYQRFSSDAFLKPAGQNEMHASQGITEYLCPPRIYNRIFWPLTNMRIRYKKESPHWVQRSKRLYRWTW